MVMEYLSRIMGRMCQLPDFRFYPMCKRHKLTHPIFADDLMIFGKENISSISRVMEALKIFSEVTG